ncbi:MAG: hypothetical protein JSW45_05485 [Thiotrichales bacterium]|nr:MAG: hypothetical protein JSW45_05485 [Thiotrichales bacterium]
MNDNMHTHDSGVVIDNMRHQHAFVVVGVQQLFGVHMTQYHCELHKYQIIVKFKIDEDIRQQLAEVRKHAPRDTFVLVNQADDPVDGLFGEFSIPELANGTVARFKADIFQGLPPFPKEDAAKPHFIPWKADYVNPVFADLTVEVERIVQFRPFAHHYRLPPFATYFLFGKGTEAHMTNLQTAALASSPFEPAVFGPDYDHVMSLLQAPDWLDKPLLEAGIVVTTPKVQLVDADTGEPTIPCDNVFAEGESVEVLYRGMGERFHVMAGPTFLQLTAVCNGPEGSYLTDRVMPCPDNPGYISTTPRVYWAVR